jgi:hypothetical protein
MTWHLATQRASANELVKIVGTNVPKTLAVFPFGDLRTYRSELRKLADAREISEIQFSARVFKHKYPNKNYVRFRDEQLGSFARSFGSQPFLQDHSQRNIASRLGTIDRSRLVEGEILQEIRITAQDGISAFIDGQIDRFSIGWDADDATCSVCQKSFMSGECSHWPGEKYEGSLCEVIFERPKGVETSAVNRPAVDGTGLLTTLMEMKKMNKQSPVIETLDEEEDVETAEGELSDAVDVLSQLMEGLGISGIHEQLADALSKLANYDELVERVETLTAKVIEMERQYNGEPLLRRIVNELPKAAPKPSYVQPPSKEASTVADLGQGAGKLSRERQVALGKTKSLLGKLNAFKGGTQNG